MTDLPSHCRSFPLTACMKPLSSLAFAISVLCASSAWAERFGSETSIVVQGTYYQTGETISTTLANGDVRSTATQTTVRVNNRTILEAMRDRNLITDIAGYRLVMVAHGHMADGVAWFATKSTGTPVAVPSDLLSINVNDGPANGQWVVNADAVLKSLRQQTVNQTSLSLAGGFDGTGLLTQTWTARSVKNGDTTEMVELVSSSGSFSGALNGSPTAGVGTAQFTLADAKIVDLTRYGMATIGGGVVATGGGTLTLGSGSTTYTGGASVTAGTLNLSGGSISATILSSSSFGGTLTINTTAGGALAGLVVDSSGTVTQLPTFTGNFQPATLIVITSSGTYTYTKDSNGAWTLVTA